MANAFGEMRDELKYEALGILMVGAAVLCYLGLYSGAGGPVADILVHWLRIGFGGAAPVLPALVGLRGLLMMIRREAVPFSGRAWGLVMGLVVFLGWLHLRLPRGTEFINGMRGFGGGLSGAAISWGLLKLFGPVGSYVVLSTLGVAGFLFVTNVSLVRAVGAFARRLWSIVVALILAARDFVFVPVEGEQAAGREKRRPGRGAAGATPAKETCREAAPTGEYRLPPLELLRRPLRARALKLQKDATDGAKLLEGTLENFGVKAKVIDVSCGPAITRYELQPAPGVKVSRILNLADDISLAMAAEVRIEAPIPGKAAVGIEVPNKETCFVYLREGLESPAFQGARSRLAVVLGKDVAGEAVVADLGKMLHLLVAGATGSGKSVCINAIIASLLFRATPAEVKLLLIDPKVVELVTYSGIPHLLAPVVTDPRQAATALKWVVQEMGRRYELFARHGVRDIEKFNKNVAATGTEGALPYIVIIIDELHDLMMVAAADVEDVICRLAQMARAAGIHLVVATQRPSVDVITGVIKANIPSRIAFAVASQTDSRTILDVNGAEKLLGRGDMLFSPVGALKPVRVQGAFISDKEVEELASFVKQQGEPRYEVEFAREEGGAEGVDGLDDPLLGKAAKLVIEARHASASFLQRRLRVGYTRAARLIDIMEERGIVGKPDGSKPREILVSREQLRKMFGD